MLTMIDAVLLINGFVLIIFVALSVYLSYIFYKMGKEKTIDEMIENKFSEGQIKNTKVGMERDLIETEEKKFLSHRSVLNWGGTKYIYDSNSLSNNVYVKFPNK